MIKSPNSYLRKLQELILSELRDDPVRVVLFGSRARGNHAAVSDVDIGIISSGSFPQGKITLLREKIEDLNIPYQVDLVNLQETSADFQKEILKGAVIWKD